MILTELSAIENSHLPISALREHLRLGTGFEDSALQDELLEVYLRAAIASVEGRIGVILVPRVFSLQLTSWRNPQEQRFPIRPLSKVTSFAIYDRLGAVVVHDLIDFDLLIEGHTPVLKSAQGGLPSIPDGGIAEIVFEAGFGPDWQAVPSDLAQATILLAANFYENRNGSDENGGIPKSVAALLERHRLVRVSRGLGDG